MGWANFVDVLAQLQGFGLLVKDRDIVTGQRRRCCVKDGGREKRGWFQLYELPKSDGSGVLIVGSFGAFWGAENLVQKIEIKKDQRQAMSAEQMEALKARIAADKKRAEAETKRRNERAAHAATLAWSKCSPEGESEYLKRKKIAAHDVRFSPQGNLVIPMRDNRGNIHGLQVIYSVKKNGRDKDFWPAGLAKKGNYHLIGGAPASVLFLAEGYATGASIFEAIKQPVAIAFDAGNLLPVAQALAKRYPRAKIVICADDDYRTEVNPGVKHAEAAALAVNGSVVVPVFADERPVDRKGPTDFNDLHALEGLDVVTAQLETHLAGQRLAVAPPAARGDSAQQGGGDSSARRDAQAIMDLDDVVERFVPIDDGTGDYVFDNWNNKIVKRAQMIALLPAGVRADDIKRHPQWINRGAFYLDQVGFDPTGKDVRIKLNTWRGFDLKPSRGDCHAICDLASFICSAEKNNTEAEKFLLDSLAHQVQHPGVKLGSAIIVQGPQGTGKSTLFNVMMSIFGQYAKTLNQRALEDKFNSDWVENTLFVKCEEIAASSDVWHVKGEVKDLITGEYLRANEKNAVARNIRNRMNFVILSNETIPMPLERDDRRFLVIRTPPPASIDFYREVHAEIENGGVERFFNFLLTRDISQFHPKTIPPMTESKRRLINASAPSEQVFIEEWLAGQIEFGKTRLPVCPCTGSQLHGAYARWARQTLVSRPRDMNQFISFIHGLPGWEAGKSCATYEDLASSIKKNRKMVVPCHESFAKAAMAGAEVIEQAEKTRQRWLTEGYCAFQVALEQQ